MPLTKGQWSCYLLSAPSCHPHFRSGSRQEDELGWNMSCFAGQNAPAGLAGGIWRDGMTACGWKGACVSWPDCFLWNSRPPLLALSSHGTLHQTLILTSSVAIRLHGGFTDACNSASSWVPISIRMGLLTQGPKWGTQALSLTAAHLCLTCT